MNAWRHARASVAGTSHAVTGQPCQDAAGVVVGAGALVAAAVTDGAGSATHSAIGADLALEAFLDLARTSWERNGGAPQYTRTDAELWVAHVQACLRERAGQLDLPIRELACTLVGVIVDEASTTVLHIGDGGVVGCHQGTYQVLSWPLQGEYVNTTFFITHEDACNHMQWQRYDWPMDDIVLFSDGVQALCLDFRTKQAYAPFFERLLHPLSAEPPGASWSIHRQLQRYLSSPAICQRTDDDKSIVLLSRRRRAPSLAGVSDNASPDKPHSAYPQV